MSMFGALNRFIARLDSEPQQQSRSTGSAAGFQVLRNSTADLPLEPWFDFIIGINGRNIDNPDASLFSTEVRNCAGASVNLGIWSAKGQKTRSIYVQVPADSASLGLSLQWTPLASTEDVWHILDVIPNSPADTAGLLPYGDYIIGSPEGLIKGESGLGELVEDYLSQPLRLHVYNHEYNVTRLVTITPSRTWGGSGALGCVLGYGALHRIPPPLDEPPSAPGDTLFDTSSAPPDPPADNAAAAGAAAEAQLDGGATPTPQGPPQFLVPADMPPSQPPGAATGPPPPAGGRGSRRHHHHHHAPASAADMDAYFAEGEAKSREQDFAATPKPSGSGLAPPPPPRAGGPPTGGPPRATSPAKPPAAQQHEEQKQDAAQAEEHQADEEKPAARPADDDLD